MHGLLFLVLTASLPAAEGPEEKLNPLYAQLREKGVPISAREHSPLPAPRMADGLDAKAQTAVIKSLIGEDFDWSVFTDDSITAPQLLMPLRQIKGGDPQAPARGLDLYFIAYGQLKKLTEKGILDRVAGSERNKGEGKALTTDDLKKRGITIAPQAEKYEGLGYVVFNLIDKVEIRVVGHSYWSETPESLLLAAGIDDRFAKDSEFPNQWRGLTKTGDGIQVGPPHPYSGAAYYVKVTQLKDPALKGALFCEIHMVFTEPFGWFQGTNQLTAKLPAAAQDMVRKLRRELKK
jgi:hypothetical protein